MSWWTEVLLTCPGTEDQSGEDAPPLFPAVEQINSWLRKNGWWDLFLIHPQNPEHHGPDGCFAGNFKSLDHAGFVAAVRAAPWEWPDQVQLFMRQEDDRGFKEIKLWGRSDA